MFSKRPEIFQVASAVNTNGAQQRAAFFPVSWEKRLRFDARNIKTKNDTHRGCIGEGGSGVEDGQMGGPVAAPMTFSSPKFQRHEA